MPVFKKKLTDAAEFSAGDATLLRELVHPDKDPVELPYSLAHARLEAGKSSLPHCLTGQSELYYFLEGKGEIYLDGKPVEAGAGEVVLVPAGVPQFVRNTGSGDLVFLCIVSPPWREKSEIILPRAK